MSAAEKPPTYTELVEVISALPPLPPKWEGADYLKRLNEATEARLRAVERERDEAVRRAADLEQVREELAEASKLTDVYVEDNQKLTAERDELVDKSLALKVALLAVREELRQEQTARAATQADLTRVEQEHDAWRDFAYKAIRERDLARAELESARQELARLRGGAS